MKLTRIHLARGKALLLMAIFMGSLITVVGLAKPNGKPFQEIWEAIEFLQEQIDNIELIPGPQGPPGPEGPAGPEGSPGTPEVLTSSETHLFEPFPPEGGELGIEQAFVLTESSIILILLTMVTSTENGISTIILILLNSKISSYYVII